MLKLLITNILKNMLVNDVKNEFKAEVINYLKANRKGLIFHLAMTFTIGFSALMSLYELIIFSSSYLANNQLVYTHLLASGLLITFSLLMGAKVLSYSMKIKLEINNRIEELKQEKLSPFTIFEPILNELRSERVRFEMAKKQEYQSQLSH